MSLRRPSVDTGNESVMTDMLVPPPIPSVRWVVEDTSQTELLSIKTAVPMSSTVAFVDRLRRSDHRAQSLPNLVDDDWTKTGAEDGKTESTQPFAMATDADVMTSLVTPTISVTSPSLSPSYEATTSSRNKAKRAASFAEHPVIKPTAVSAAFNCFSFYPLITLFIGRLDDSRDDMLCR